jgi:hypothetical protein
MEIEFLRSVAMARTISPRRGQRADLPEEEARSLIEAGHAKAVVPESPRRPTEQASRTGGETHPRRARRSESSGG